MSDNMGNTQRFCGNCGTPTTPGYAFCGSCGTLLSGSPPERRVDRSRSSSPSWVDGVSSRLRSLSGRDALAGVIVAVACAALLVAGIYALLFARGAFEDPLVPRGVGFVIFALAHGGAVSVDVPQIPELFGLGGSAKLGLPITSFVLLPFVAALFIGRAVAGRVGNPWLFALSAAFSYAAISGLIALFGAVSAEDGGATIRVAAEPLSTAVRAFLWVGLATAVAASAASLPMLPARIRQILRGTLVAAATGIFLTGILALVLTLFQGGASPTEGVPGNVSEPSSSGGSARDFLSGVGGFVALLPAMLGNLWLFAHGLPVGLHGAPDFSGVPFLGEALADVPLRLALLGEWPFGWEWRLLPIAPAIGIFLGGMVAAGGARGEHRIWQGAAVAVPYTAVAFIAALLVGVSAELTVAGASFDVAVRASLAWMLLLLPVAGAVLGGLGGLLAGEWSSFAPRPKLAFASTAALSSILLVASLPVFAMTSAPQNPLPTDPMAFEEPMDDEPLFEMPEEPEMTLFDNFDEGFEWDSPEEEPPDSTMTSPDSTPDSAFDAILPTLRETTTAPIMLPAELPSDLRNTAVDAAYSGDEYGVLFLAEPTGNVVEDFVRAYTVGTLTASPNDPEPNEYFAEASSEAVALPDGTEATLRYMEPTMGGGNAGPYWEGEFERDGYIYTLTTPLADPSGDIARQTLSTMVEAPNDGGEMAETPDTSESAEQEFITEYYEAVGNEDWAATYYLLDSESQLEFTEDEWVAVQAARQDASGAAPVESAEISDISGEGASFVADVLLTYTDGSQETVPGIEVYFEYGGYWRHLSESDIEYLRGIQEEYGLTSYDGEDSFDEDLLSEEFAIEDTIYAHYDAIGAGDFYGAYSYFGPTFRSSNDEATWVADEESYGITYAAVDYVEVLSVSGDSATAAVDVSFEDETGAPSFSLVWDLVKEDGAWKLDSVSGGEA
ncbi:MAG: zinc ribbon domain-containing protein [Actinomycetota bacterium]|nr:zinc ribbon domain-containing protein [Actinomycetota bacterium]